MRHVVHDHRLDILNVQESGRFSDQQRFFFPALHNAVTSIGEVAHHSIATFFNPCTFDHVTSSTLMEGRATITTFRDKQNPGNLIINYNIYEFSGNTRDDRIGQA